MWHKNKVFTRTTGLSLFYSSLHEKRNDANMPVRKGMVHHARANILARKFKFSGWKILSFVLNPNILSPNAPETLTAEVCSFRTFKPTPVASAVLPRHRHGWGSSLQTAQPGPSPAVEAWAITTSLLSLSAHAKLQLTQIPHITALFAHISQECAIESTVCPAARNGCSISQVQDRAHRPEQHLPILLCTCSKQIGEFISGNCLQELRNLYFSLHIEEKLTE